MPFTDPMADGVTIQRASQAALAQGVSLRWILERAAARSAAARAAAAHELSQPAARFRLERLAGARPRAGVCGFIVPDLPLDESDELRAALARAGLALVQMVTPVTRARATAPLVRRRARDSCTR